MIQILDNKIPDMDKIYEELKTLPYYYGEVDQEDYYPTGMTTELSVNNITYTSLKNFISNSEVKKKNYNKILCKFICP